MRKVCTVEIILPLAEAAAKLLRGLGHDNVSVKAGDGYHGWPECGPFDAVIVTAALEHVPPPLIEQLKVGGRLVMPVGAVRATQQLTVVEKIAAASDQDALRSARPLCALYPLSALNVASGRGPADQDLQGLRRSVTVVEKSCDRLRGLATPYIELDFIGPTADFAEWFRRRRAFQRS